jgi:3-mercaptopyruvate sulfurtransferase SseA
MKIMLQLITTLCGVPKMATEIITLCGSGVTASITLLF